MSQVELFALQPLAILGAASILALLASAFIRTAAASFVVALAGMAAALAAVWFVWPLAPVRVTSFLVLDHFALFTIALIIAATIVTAASSIGSLSGRRDEHGEYFFLLVLGCLGASVLAASGNFAALFLGLELLSVTLFVLIAYRREHLPGAEAGIKYLILAGVSSAFLLFGMALAYAAVGTMELSEVARLAASGEGGFVLLSGLALLTVGAGFKLAVVPFHFWTPDIYDGASSPVAGFIATVSKGAMAALLVRFLAPVGISALGAFVWVFPVISAVTMFVGNLLALREDNVKRILAYSSIAHLGYLLIAFISGGTRAVSATAFFLAAYFASTLGAFSSVASLSAVGREADGIEDYRGLASRTPWRAGCLTACLLSLAGLPLTAGFMGKFVLFAAGGASLQWVLIVLLAVNSTISLFYYLKIVSAMYRSQPEPRGGSSEGRTPRWMAAHGAPAGAPAAVLDAGGGRNPASFFAGLAVALTTLAVVALGVYPAPLLSLIEMFSSP
jgi:NADH-quinone oxidoreductase subunit N